MKTLSMNKTMTKAILDGSKTQTRRIFPLKNKQLIFKNFQGFDKICALFDNQEYGENYVFECIPLSLKIGDEFWIRESVEIIKITKLKNKTFIDFKYCVDGVEIFDFEIPQEHKKKKWIRVGTKIPNGCLKEMARLYCVVTDISVEKLQEISIDSIIKEGFDNKEMIHNFEYNDQLSRYYNKKWASHVVNDKEKAAYYDELCKKYYQKMKENGQEIRNWFINLWNNVSKDGFKFKDNPYVQVITFQRKDM